MPSLHHRFPQARRLLPLIAIVLVLCSAPSGAVAPAERKVLIIYSLGADATSVWQRSLTGGIATEVGSGQGRADRPEVFTERLDVMRVGRAPALKATAPYLKTKYADIAFDAVIAESFHASGFLQAHPELFPGVPRFYVNHEREGFAPADGSALGIDVDFERAIDTMIASVPGLKRIAVVGDPTLRGQAWVDALRALAPRYRGRVAFEFWDRQRFDELYRKAATLGPGSAIYMFPVYEDSTGAAGKPPAVARTLAERAPVPVFVHVDSLIVPGVAGGYVVSAEQVGRAIGRIVVGKPASLDGVQQHVFDYQVARRFGLRPIEGTRWLNRERSVWDDYRWQIIAGLTLIALQAVLISALVRASRGRRRNMEALNAERDKLEEKVAERTRELQSANALLEKQVTTYALTGIGNRRRMTAAISVELDRAHRFSHPLTLLMIDIDQFKRVNDSYGHDAGDLVLVAVARALSTALRACDSAARFGGEEFVVLMPETGLEVAREAAERLRCAVAALRLGDHQGKPIAITISVGVAQYLPEQGAQTPSSLLSRADRAMYRAKSEGRNKVLCET